jgi:hypothetical protein
VTSGQSSSNDRRSRFISATPEAATVLAGISSSLQAILPHGGKGKRGRGFAGAAAFMERLAKMVQRASRGKGERKHGEAEDDVEQEDAPSAETPRT